MNLALAQTVQSELDDLLDACPIQRLLEAESRLGNLRAGALALERRVRVRMLLEWTVEERLEQQRIAERAMRNAERIRECLDLTGG